MNDKTPNLPAINSGGQVRAIIPQNFEETWRIANAVAIAGMAPKGLDTPEKAMIAIMHGAEIGLAPMMALQSIAVVNGRPSLWGDAALALVQASGKMVSIKEWIDGVGDARIAYCHVVRKGDGEPKIGKFSVTDAKQAGLWNKKGRNGEPTPWITYPERMLQLRARGFALRDKFADVLRGLAIAEEMQDVELTRTEPGGAFGLPRAATTPPTPPTPPANGGEQTNGSQQGAQGQQQGEEAAGQEGTAETADAAQGQQEGGYRAFDDDTNVVDAEVEEIADEKQEGEFNMDTFFDHLRNDLAEVQDMEGLEAVWERYEPERSRLPDETNRQIATALRKSAERRLKSTGAKR